MTTRYYGADLGVGPADVTESSSTTSKAVELAVVFTTTGMTKTDVLKALEAIEAKVTVDPWPPA